MPTSVVGRPQASRGWFAAIGLSSSVALLPVGGSVRFTAPTSVSSVRFSSWQARSRSD